MICGLRFIKCALIAFLISFLILFHTSSSQAASSNSAKSLLKTAQQCKEKLYRSSSNKKYRHNWEKCLKAYETVYQKFPDTDEAVHAMFAAGQLWADLSGYSSRDSDLDKAVSTYRELVSKYNSHYLADDAQYKLGEIFHQKKKDPKQAYVEFLKVEIKFPNGDSRKKASEMLQELEGVLGKKNLKEEEVKKADDKEKGLIIVKNIRHWSTPTYTRVVIDLENRVKYKEHLLKKDPDLKKPRRLYVDLENAWISKGIESSIPIKDDLLRGARAGQYDKTTVRVVLDIDNMEGYKIFHLYDPFRIVVDVQGKKDGELRPQKEVVAKKPGKEDKKITIKDTKQQKVSLAKQLGLGVNRIVIDAGHGGKDPGAVGKNGLKEKDTVLKAANLLAKKIREELGCEAVLTRGNDTFLELERRTAIANVKKADLFISLHVNAHRYSKVQGLETYFLNIALDEDSMNLAARENATSKKNISDLQVILNDLMLNTKINESSRLAKFVHNGMVEELRKTYGNVKSRGVKQAPFYVLIGADMPSILVEIGYITNSVENKRLSSESYLDRVASGIVKGIDSYIKDMEAAYKGG
jgi:N-acetylmuramoyl-L-alanine amidase